MRVTDMIRNGKWRLLTFRKGMLHFSAMLVLSALVSGIFGSRIYFMFASSTVGVLLAAGAWFRYCRWKDGKPLRDAGMRIPDIYRSAGRRKRYKPAFLMTSRDFDDDLTAYTMAAEEDFSDAERQVSEISANLVSAFLLLAVSFIIR